MRSISARLLFSMLFVAFTVLSDICQAFAVDVPTNRARSAVFWRSIRQPRMVNNSQRRNTIISRKNNHQRQQTHLFQSKSRSKMSSHDHHSTGRRRRPGNNLAVSFLSGFWKGITLPFPALRKVFLDTDKHKNMKIGLRFRESLIGVLLYLSAGVLAYHTVLEQWPILDSLYFTTVCFTTVGYGDISPSNTASKIFTCLFGLGGIAFLGSAIATVSSSVIQAESSFAKIAKKQSKRRLMQVFEGMPHVLEPFRHKSKQHQANHFSKARDKVVSSMHVPHWLEEVRDAVINALPSLFIIFGGGAAMHKLNGSTGTWVDAIYFSLVTASTIGLGDIVPKTRNAKIFAIFYIPLAVAAAGELLSGAATRMMERRQREVYKQQIEKDFTISNLKAMDSDGDGKISREEYLQFMLIEMGVVEKKELRELDQQFDRLDKDGSGFLSTWDLEMMAKYRGVSVVD